MFLSGPFFMMWFTAVTHPRKHMVRTTCLNGQGAAMHFSMEPKQVNTNTNLLEIVKIKINKKNQL